MSESVPTTSTPSAPASKKSQAMAAALAISHYGSLLRLSLQPPQQCRRAAKAAGSSPTSLKSFENVSWTHWLALVIPYCFLYLLIDSLVVWAVINWFNAKIRYADILPIRASAYILSLVNEQVSKGAIAALSEPPGRRARLGDRLQHALPDVLRVLQPDAVGVHRRDPAVEPHSGRFSCNPLDCFGLPAFSSCFSICSSAEKSARESALRERQIFRAFRLAKVWHYGAVIVMRAPLVIAGVIVYTLALRLFGGTVGFGEMLGYLPVIFFGAAMPGPMHSVAILFWVLLYPDRPGQMTAFGFVMHNFFIFFNAGVGLLFLRRASREMFG